MTSTQVERSPVPQLGIAWIEADWMDYGTCRVDEVDPYVFFSEAEWAVEVAAAACVRCHVRRECLVYAIRNKERGFWGGTSDEERDRIRRRRIGRLL